MTLHLQIIGRNSEIPHDAFQRLGIANGLAPSVLPLGPSMPLALFHSGAVPGSAPDCLGQSGLVRHVEDARPRPGVATRPANGRFRGNQSKQTPVNRPERPVPPSVPARADGIEVLLWLAAFLIVMGVGRLLR